MMKQISIMIFFLSCTYVAAGDIYCSDKGKITYIYKKKIKTEKASYCFNKKTGYLIQQSCLGKKKCLANTKTGNDIPKSIFTGEFGNPTFRVCRYLEGRPQIIKVWDGEKYHKISRCRFSDNSWIDNDTLYSNQKIN